MIKRLLLAVAILGTCALPLFAQTWRPGRQIMIWPRPDTTLLGDSLVFIGLVRTSTGAAVMAPRVTWSTSPAGRVFAREVANNAASIVSADSGTLRIIAEWRTTSGVFRDTLTTVVKWRPYQWKLNQRVLLVATDTILRRPGDSTILTAIARTSSGVRVTNPGLVWEANPINDFTIDNTIRGRTVIKARPDTLGGFQSWVKVLWRTSTGEFTDSVRITTSRFPASDTGAGSTPPTDFTPNLPAGLQLVGDDTYDTAPTLQVINWSGITAQSPSTFGVSIVNTDVGRALRAWFPEQHAGDGVGPLTINTPILRTRSVYMAVRLRYSPNYVIHTNTEKLFYPVSENPRSGSGLVNIHPERLFVGKLTPFEFVGPAEGLSEPNVFPPPGQWFHAEFYVRYNTPGQSDGIWRVWVNGRLVINRTNHQFFRDVTTQPVIEYGRLDFTRGGGASTILTPIGGQWVDVDRLAFYAGN